MPSPSGMPATVIGAILTVTLALADFFAFFAVTVTLPVWLKSPKAGSEHLNAIDLLTEAFFFATGSAWAVPMPASGAPTISAPAASAAARRARVEVEAVIE